MPPPLPPGASYPDTPPSTAAPPPAARTGPPLPPGASYVYPPTETQTGQQKEQPGGVLEELGTGFAHGLGNIVYGAGQFATHLLPGSYKGSLAEKMDQAAATREAEYQKHPHSGWATAGNIAGEIVGTLPLDLIPGAGPAALAARVGRYGRAAVKGAEIAAAEPVTEPKDDYWTDKMKQAAIGAGGGAAGERLIAGAGRALAPRVSQDVQELANVVNPQTGRSVGAVRMTPGQLGAGGSRFGLGAQLRRVEESLKSWPVLGEFIRGGQQRSVDDFNRAAINQVLDVLGERLPEDMAVGRDAIAHMQDRVSANYQNVLGGLTFNTDQPWMAAMRNAAQNMDGLPDAQIRQFRNILYNNVFRPLGVRRFVDFERLMRGPPVNPGLRMDGQTLKRVESDLGQLATQYRSSSMASERHLGRVIGNVQEEVRDALERQNPTRAADLRDANLAYAMSSRVGAASAGRGATGTGVFRPVDLVTAVRTGDKSRLKRAFQRGDALMQAYAETAQRVLPGTMPDSGTPERFHLLSMLREAIFGLAGGGTAAATGHLMPLVAGTAIGSLPYTQLGQRLVQGYALPGAVRQATRQAGGQLYGDILARYADPAFAMIAAGQPQAPR